MKKVLSILIIVSIFSIVLVSASLIIIEAATSKTSNIKLIAVFVNERLRAYDASSIDTSTVKGEALTAPALMIIVPQKSSFLADAEVSCLFPIPKTAMPAATQEVAIAKPLKAPAAINTSSPQISLQDKSLEQAVQVTEARLIYLQMVHGVASSGDQGGLSP